MRLLTRWMIALTFLGLTAPVMAEDSPPAAPAAGTTEAEPELLEQVRQAYRDTQQYQATVKFQSAQASGRVTQIQAMEFYIAFDRQTQRLLIDKPDMYVVVADGQFKMKSDQIPSYYLDAALTQPMSEWNGMLTAMPLAFRPRLPDVAFLVADDPSAALGGLGFAKIEAGDEADTLKVKTSEGLMVMHVDPQTYLIDRAEVDVPGYGNSKVTLHYDFDIQKRNESIDPEVFKFEPGRAKPAATLAALQTSLQNEANAAQGAQQPMMSAESQALMNKPVPNIEIKTIDGKTYTLGKTEERVVILDFWGTWCLPCHAWLPRLQEIHDWAQKENLSVLILAVDNKAGNPDEPAAALKFWEDKGYTMPMALDEDESIFEAFVPIAFPQTYIIVDGELRIVHSGIQIGVTEHQVRDEILKALQGDQPGEPAPTENTSKSAPGS